MNISKMYEGRKFYVAGPMTGYKNFNEEAFDTQTKHLRSLGAVVFNPAEKDREIYGEDILKSPTGAIADAADKGFDLLTTIKLDAGYIINEATDILMLRGWEKSTGARAEHALAVWKGITVHYE